MRSRSEEGGVSDGEAEDPSNPIVVLDTTEGAISVEIFLHKAPLTGSSILDLVRSQPNPS
jgi:hypothetical protein